MLSGPQINLIWQCLPMNNTTYYYYYYYCIKSKDIQVKLEEKMSSVGSRRAEKSRPSRVLCQLEALCVYSPACGSVLMNIKSQIKVCSCLITFRICFTSAVKRFFKHYRLEIQSGRGGVRSLRTKR